MTTAPAALPRTASLAYHVRAGLILALLALAAVGWVVTVQRMGGMDAGPGTDPGALGFWVTAWVVMMVAMMFPSVAPRWRRSRPPESASILAAQRRSGPSHCSSRATWPPGRSPDCSATSSSRASARSAHHPGLVRGASGHGGDGHGSRGGRDEGREWCDGWREDGPRRRPHGRGVNGALGARARQGSNPGGSWTRPTGFEPQRARKGERCHGFEPWRVLDAPDRIRTCDLWFRRPRRRRRRRTTRDDESRLG
jgi:hypothetical protein